MSISEIKYSFMMKSIFGPCHKKPNFIICAQQLQISLHMIAVRSAHLLFVFMMYIILKLSIIKIVIVLWLTEKAGGGIYHVCCDLAHNKR